MANELLSLPEGTVALSPLVPVHVTSLQIAPVLQDFSLVFTSPRMGDAETDGQKQPVVQFAAVVSLVASAVALKDMSLLLATVVKDYEKQWGEIETLYTRKLAAEVSEKA